MTVIVLNLTIFVVRCGGLSEMHASIKLSVKPYIFEFNLSRTFQLFSSTLTKQKLIWCISKKKLVYINFT